MHYRLKRNKTGQQVFPKRTKRINFFECLRKWIPAVQPSWFRIANKRIKFKLAPLMFRCLQLWLGSSLPFCWLHPSAPSRLPLRSSSTNGLVVRASRLVIVGDRAFPVAGSNLRNGLSDEFTSPQSQFSAVTAYMELIRQTSVILIKIVSCNIYKT